MLDGEPAIEWGKYGGISAVVNLVSKDSPSLSLMKATAVPKDHKPGSVHIGFQLATSSQRATLAPTSSYGDEVEQAQDTIRRDYKTEIAVKGRCPAASCGLGSVSELVQEEESPSVGLGLTRS
ncbi:hypothetical protein ColTof4_14073 [Colletotrichum tofieldiae]|nr:hypothetical protein ColTof3_14710 [Colletotrichum tofieldiae]GKT81650.1 hypothetical protein ColTof4_14073 [Colletotrichum tofieldiae]GKT97622.1 hypothetical protein Ct61P_15472 [Colletotrichum tofieldiae]